MSNPKHTPGSFRRYFKYFISETGHVYSTTGWRGHSSRPMRQSLNKDGYKYVRLTIDGRRIKFRVHKLVCELFHGLPPSGLYEVCHIDGDKLNNCAANLRWGTRKDNAADRELHGRTSRGTKHSEFIKNGIAKSKNPFWRHAR